MATRRLARSLARVGVAAGVGVLVSPATAFAAGSYGGPTPTPGATGAFSQVITVQTVGAGGGTVVAIVDGATIDLTVPAGDFTASVQVVITAGNLSELTNTGISGTPFLAFGTQIDQNGQKLAGPFANPIGLKVSDSPITSSTVVYEQSGASFVQASGWTPSVGVDDGGFSVDPNFLLANPLATSSIGTGLPSSTGTGLPSSTGTGLPSSTGTGLPSSVGTAIPGATTATTGKPFLGEGILALGLIGIGGLGTWRWRRSRVRA